jgi:putative transposase
MLSRKKTGGPWRLIPQECGHWRPLYGDCKRWRRDGLWARLLATLRQGERRCLGRPPAPAAGRMDSQRSKTATQRAASGFAGHKTSTGRTRHVLVDTLGLRIAVVGTAASPDARLGVVALRTAYVAAGGKRRRTSWVDGASPAEGLEEGVRGVKQTHNIALEATPHQEGQGFHGMPWRGAVARTCAWWLTDRRHRRDYERLTAHSAAMIQMSMMRLLLNRLV